MEELEKKAFSKGWIYRRHINQPCTGCFKQIREGFVLSPGLNYPICVSCAEKEFNGFRERNPLDL